MDMETQDKFIRLWRKFFNNAELPITFYYSDRGEQAELAKPGSVDRCVIGALVEVRKGRSYSFNSDSIGCFGGRRYLGFAGKMRPDVLSGLFTLMNFDESQPEAVIAPMGSGCSSIVSYPYLEKDSPHPRAVIGMFDPSARPHLPEDALSFSVPMTKFVRMIENMESSFLITDTWKTLQKRID